MPPVPFKRHRPSRNTTNNTSSSSSSFHLSSQNQPLQLTNLSFDTTTNINNNRNNNTMNDDDTTTTNNIYPIATYPLAKYEPTPTTANALVPYTKKTSTALIPLSPRPLSVQDSPLSSQQSPMSDDAMYIDTSNLRSQHNSTHHHSMSLPRVLTAEQVLSYIRLFLIRFYKQFQLAAKQNSNLFYSYQARHQLQNKPLSQLNYYHFYLLQQQHELESISSFNPTAPTLLGYLPNLNTNQNLLTFHSQPSMNPKSLVLLNDKSFLSPSFVDKPQIGYIPPHPSPIQSFNPNNNNINPFFPQHKGIKRHLHTTPTISPNISPIPLYQPQIPSTYDQSIHFSPNPYNHNNNYNNTQMGANSPALSAKSFNFFSLPGPSGLYHDTVQIEEIIDDSPKIQTTDGNNQLGDKSPLLLLTPRLAPVMSDLHLTTSPTQQQPQEQHQQQQQQQQLPQFMSPMQQFDYSALSSFNHYNNNNNNPPPQVLQPALQPSSLIHNPSFLPVNNNNNNNSNLNQQHPLYQQMIQDFQHTENNGDSSPPLSIVPMTVAFSELSLHQPTNRHP